MMKNFLFDTQTQRIILLYKRGILDLIIVNNNLWLAYKICKE